MRALFIDANYRIVLWAATRNQYLRMISIVATLESLSRDR